MKRMFGAGLVTFLLPLAVFGSEFRSKTTSTKPPQPAQIVPNRTHLEAGDILVFSSINPVMRALGLIALSGNATHAALVVRDKEGQLALLETPTVGAHVKLNKINDSLAKYHGKIWVRQKLEPITPEQSQKLTQFAYTQLGKPYDFVGFMTLPVSPPVTRQAQKEPKPSEPRSWFCSSLVIGGCCSAGMLDCSKIRNRGVRAGDLKNDVFLDLSEYWGPPTPLPKPSTTQKQSTSDKPSETNQAAPVSCSSYWPIQR